MKYDISKSPTRSARRTLEAFSSALFGLCAEKPFERISASELCERAGYPRATFYNYFDDKFDLLEYCWHRLADELDFEGFRDIDPEQVPFVFFGRMCDMIDRNADAAAAIARCNEAAGYFFASMRTFMDARVREIMLAGLCGRSYPVPLELMAEHYAGTLLLVLRWLYLRDASCTREQARETLAYLLGNL